MPPTTRLCTKCSQTKNINEFVKDRRKLFGRGYACKECESNRFKKRRGILGEALKERERIRYWNHRDVMLERNRQTYRRHGKKPPDPLKEKARQITKYAVKVGHITRRPCEVCSSTKVEVHHPDYNKPLEIMWLCKKHHAEWHRLNKAIPPVTPNHQD